MFLKKIKRCSNKATQRYADELQAYLVKNALAIVQRIATIPVEPHELTEIEAKCILGNNYPLAPWVNSRDVIGQFVVMFEKIGCVFSANSAGTVLVDAEGLSKMLIRNHLKIKGRQIMVELGTACQKTSKISYVQMRKILGFAYPSVSGVIDANVKSCIIMFLDETGIPFKFDDNHIYFP